MKQEKKKIEKDQLDARDDKLALMVQRGFLEMKGEFDKMRVEMNERFEKVEGRLDRMEDQMTDVLNNQDKMMKDMEDLKEENTVDIVIHKRLEKRIAHLERDMAKVKVKIKV